MLQLQRVSQGYASHTVFEGINLTLTPGITGLLGPNGSGKTTLLRTMATLMPPRAGQLKIEGVPIDGEHAARRARRSIGYLPQAFGYPPRMSATDFVAYGVWLRGPADADFDPVELALRAVDLWDQRASSMKSLSGGMRQRAGIAWAIAGQPKVVLLDEPTVGLDPSQRLQFRELLERLDDTTVVLSTHLIDDVAAVCDRVIVMSEGGVCFDGSVAEMAAHDDAASPGNTPLERAYMSLLSRSSRSV